jgi:hypothetical protein
MSASNQNYDIYQAVKRLTEDVTRLVETQQQVLENPHAGLRDHAVLTNKWLAQIAQILLTAELHRGLAIDELRPGENALGKSGAS